MAYVQNRFVGKSIDIFKKMKVAGVNLGLTIFSSSLLSCVKVGALQPSMQIHQIMKKRIFVKHCSSQCSSSYGCEMGKHHNAFKLFGIMLQRNVISWTPIIIGCAQNGFIGKAL